MTSSYIPALRFSFLTSLYDPIVKWTTRESTFKRSLLEQAHIERAERVLDVGCGTGTLAIAAAMSERDARVVGLDGDTEILAIAKRKAQTANARVNFTHSRATHMPFESESFDKVLSSLFFHHLTREDKSTALAEMFRVLVPGGHLHVADWGRPANAFSRMLFVPVQLLDGFATTTDSVKGRLPQYISDAGFHNVEVKEEIATMLGTMTLYAARKPGDAA